MTADALGAKLDRITFDATFTTATADCDLGFMKIQPDGGRVQGYHRGWVGERDVVTVGFNWTMGEHVPPPSRWSTATSFRCSGRPTCVR